VGPGAIPHTDPEARRVRADPTLRRPLTVRTVEAPEAIFRDLLDDLTRTADFVRAIGAGDYTITQRGEGEFDISDNRGASARVQRIVTGPGVRVYRALGRMTMPLGVRAVTGLGLISVRFEPHPQAPEARTLVGGQIYFRLTSKVLHALLKPFLPLVHGVIDRKVGLLVDAARAACRETARDRER
jgi:hypothetical protein